MKALDDDQIAVRELAREVDPLDMVAHLLVRGFRVIWPCKICRGAGWIKCTDPRCGITLLDGKPVHACGSAEGRAECPEPRCTEQRLFLTMASIEADRLRQEGDVSPNRDSVPRPVS